MQSIFARHRLAVAASQMVSVTAVVVGLVVFGGSDASASGKSTRLVASGLLAIPLVLGALVWAGRRGQELVSAAEPRSTEVLADKAQRLTAVVTVAAALLLPLLVLVFVAFPDMD